MRAVVRLMVCVVMIAAILAQRNRQKHEDIYGYIGAGQLWVSGMIALLAL